MEKKSNEKLTEEIFDHVKVSVYQGMIFYKNVPFTEIFKNIKNRFFAKQITAIREGRAKGDESWKKLKKNLPAFTPCGEFDKIRQLQFLTKYNSIIVIDFDNISEDINEVHQFANLASEDKYTFASFIGPRGTGLKIFTKVNTTAEHHAIAFEQVAAHYSKSLNLRIDPTGKDINRLCFVSSDENAFYNVNAGVFEVDITNNNNEVTVSIGALQKITLSNEHSQFEKCIELTKNRMQFFEGNRNNFVTLLANNCNRWGIPRQEAINQIISSEFCYDQKEVVATTLSAYKNESQYNTFPLRKENLNTGTFASLQVCNRVIESVNLDTEPFMDNPLIPEFVYDNLPELLKKGIYPFQEPRERDVFLTGSLGVLSGCFPKLSGEYDRKTVYSNLYIFITAPAACGKGSMDFTKNYGIEYHNELAKRNTADFTKPKALLFIPGNGSSSAIMGHLEQTSGSGIFFETEADSITNALKNDWGNYSDFLRKSYHHESVAHTRKAEFEYSELMAPKVSMVLSGTPDQVLSLTKSVSNGLFSRFLFYSYKSNFVWHDVSPCGEIKNLTDYFNDIRKESFELINIFRQFDKVNFSLKVDQWQTLNEVQAPRLTEIVDEHGDNAAALAVRMGIMWFRLAMILSAVRSNGKINQDAILECTDIDFEISKQLMEVYMVHILSVFSTIPKQPNAHSDALLNNYFDSLPSEFQRREAVTIAERLRFSPRKSDTFLSILVGEKKLERVKGGMYKKVI